MTSLQIDINNLKQELKELKSKNFILKDMTVHIEAQVISIKDRIKYCNEPLTDSPLSPIDMIILIKVLIKMNF